MLHRNRSNFSSMFKLFIHENIQTLVIVKLFYVYLYSSCYRKYFGILLTL